MLKLTKTGLLHLCEILLASVQEVTEETSPMSLVDVGDFWYVVVIAKASSLNTGSLSSPTHITNWLFIFNT